MGTGHPRAAILCRSSAAALICCSAQLAPAAVDETYLVHGTARSCSSITQLDSALADNAQSFFAGWTEQDYADAMKWSQACTQFGWHIPGRPRVQLLQAQHDRALGAPPPAAPAPAAGAAAPDMAAPSAPASGAGDGQLLVPASPGIPISGPAAPTSVGAAPAAPAPLPIAPAAKPTDTEADSLVNDEFMKRHFHEEALWVAGKARLDIGSDRGASGWLESGSSAQMKNRMTADRIVLYCARKTMSSETDRRPLLWDWRWCESEEAAAYNRLVSGNEYPSAGRAVFLGCANVESYVHVERCIATLTEPPSS